MPIKKGLASLVNSTPEFSNQGLENAINEFKVGWVEKTINLDTAIKENNVLTTTQKNNARQTINNHPHLNIGRYINDLLDHTNTILDGTVVFLANPDTEDTASFLEILSTVQAIQNLIPDLYGVPASEKGRDVNDHLGTLNNKFLETEDSSDPVFTSLSKAILFINDKAIATDTAYQTALTNMKTFVDSVVADSTDFQQTLDGHATAVATAATNFHNALGNEPYLGSRTDLHNANEAVDTQVALEKSNLAGIRTYSQTLNDVFTYTSLADNEDTRLLMTRIAQNPNWIAYFRDYEENSAALNPVYELLPGETRSGAIDRLLADAGLPDVLDSVDLEAVADKAKRDPRVDTKNFDRLTVEQQITNACKQLGISVENRSILNQSDSLLNNLNKQDRDTVEKALDLNSETDTYS
jgi:hypothetical protein